MKILNIILLTHLKRVQNFVLLITIIILSCSKITSTYLTFNENINNGILYIHNPKTNIEYIQINASTQQSINKCQIKFKNETIFNGWSNKITAIIRINKNDTILKLEFNENYNENIQGKIIYE